VNEQTNKLIEALAQKLGTTAEHLWGVLVKQARVELIVTAIEIPLMLLAMYICFRYIIYIFKLKPEDGEIMDVLCAPQTPIRIVCFVSCWLILAVCFIFICVNLEQIPTLIYNPEYWALKEILGK